MMTIEQVITILNAMGREYGFETPVFANDHNASMNSNVQFIRDIADIFAWECETDKEKQKFDSHYYVTFEV